MPSTNPSPLRIGILGTSFGATHARIYQHLPGVEVAGIVGRNEQKTLEAARSLGIPGYTDPAELIERPDVDAIDICYPTPLHAEMAIAALLHGKHVLCETPAAYTLEEARQMAQAAQSSGRRLLVALFGRFVPEYHHIHEFVQSGRLGDPRVVFADRRTPAIWGRLNQHLIEDLMNHDIDFVYWLLGKPAAVTGRGLKNPEVGWDQIFVSLEYPQANAMVEGCGIMPASFPFSTGLRVVGEEGALDLSWYWGGESPVSQVRYYPKSGEPEVLSIPGYDPYEAECKHFIDCARNDLDSNILGIEAACGSLAISLAAKASLEQGGRRIEL